MVTDKDGAVSQLASRISDQLGGLCNYNKQTLSLPHDVMAAHQHKHAQVRAPMPQVARAPVCFHSV